MVFSCIFGATYNFEFTKNVIPNYKFLLYKRPDNNMSSALFLYEGVMEVDGKTFTVCSMISEKHDTLSICTWLKRWLKCCVKPPKMVISDQSLALMSAIVQSFTQYNSLEEYLKICLK